MAKHAAKKRHSNFFYACFICLAALLAMGGIALLGILAPFNVTVNGEAVTVGFLGTVQDAVNASTCHTKPGNLLAVDGSLLEEGAGIPTTATVNGSDPVGFDFRLSPNDSIEVSDGIDQMEPFHTEEALTPAGATISGSGAVHKVTEVAENGKHIVKVGDISGISVEEPIQDPKDAAVTKTNVDTGGAPLVALTFDDGPWHDYTAQILDALAANGAKATFFVVGNRIDEETIGVVQRAAAEGHQVSTHTYSHASGSGRSVNLGYMTPEEQIDEVVSGLQAIKDATGIEPSKYIRVPGGNFGESVIANLSPYIAGDIGWNIDTRDWERPGVDDIKTQLLSVEPGNIVLMHDGGGDRSQTVEALMQALPELAARGYQFVTIDELMQYVQ